MTSIVSWNDIIAECGNYKAGFVAVFRKYKDQSTDERDNSNRVVKVTAASFAQHMGIEVRTFQGWVKREVDEEYSSTSAREARTAVSHANVAKNMARNAPARLVEAIELAGPQAADKVFHELKLRRAGIDTSEANRKGAEAWAHKQTEPFRQMAAAIDLALCAQTLDEATEILQQAMTEEILTSEKMAPIEAAFERFSFALAEARFRIS